MACRLKICLGGQMWMTFVRQVASKGKGDPELQSNFLQLKIYLKSAAIFRHPSVF
jgi:hypothetical protein